jgi:hypothetical protein
VFSIWNEDLVVELLDLAVDHARLGPRFAWGGYIWQVQDRRVGPLLTGPEWPVATPIPFNGQGAPESFRHRTRDGQPLTWNGTRGVAIGAGEIAEQTGELRVIAPCAWNVHVAATEARWSTRHAVAEFDYHLERIVALHGRELCSATRLTNHASAPLALEWFVHPFFALADGRIALELPAAATLPENPGFALVAGRLTQQRVFRDQYDGQFELLQLPAGEPLRCRLTHPKLSHVDFATSFVPSACPVWGNSNTFSIEPYLVTTLAPGATLEWELRYGFGAVR